MIGIARFAAVAAALALTGCGRAPMAQAAGVGKDSDQKPAARAGQSKQEVATLAGGCFWCMEAIFQRLKGVSKVEPGYSGGHGAHPTYEQVSSGSTGHAESVQITFDPRTISYSDLLHVFFTLHDPTTQDRQGADVGTQYRSVVFYRTAEQKQTAERVIAEITNQKVWPAPIVTEVSAFTAFYPAEEHHRDYYNRNRSQPYCRIIIDPKVAKLREKFLGRLKRE